jgi:hypothetical protein
MGQKRSSLSMAVGKYPFLTVPTIVPLLKSLSIPFAPAPLTNCRDRTSPVGYKLSTIAFSSGSPVASSDSLTSTADIFANADNKNCPDECFRPVGLALDSQERIFMSSDSTGEIWVLVRTAASATSTSTGTATGTSASSTPTNNAKTRWSMGVGEWWAALLALAVCLAL